MSTYRSPAPIALAAIVLAAVVTSGCGPAGRPVIVVVSGTTSQSESLRAAAREAERLDKARRPGWSGADLAETNAAGLARLSEARIDSSIVAIIVLERTPHDAEPLGRIASSGMPIVALDRPTRMRARTAVAAVDRALRESARRDRREERAKIAAALGNDPQSIQVGIPAP